MHLPIALYYGVAPSDMFNEHDVNLFSEIFNKINTNKSCIIKCCNNAINPGRHGNQLRKLLTLFFCCSAEATENCVCLFLLSRSGQNC